MKRASVTVAVLLALACLSRCAAGEGAAAPRDPSPLDSLAWLAGYWVGEQEGAEIEEYWMEPKGNLMLGLHRDLLPAGNVVFEYLRIEKAPQGTVYVASPGGGESTPFVLASTGERRAVFENLEHDFPQRIIYWREGDQLGARIEGDTPEGRSSIEWSFKLAGRPDE